MKTLYKNPNGNTELDVIQTSETEMEDGALKATDVSCGFLLKAFNGREVFVSDEMLAQLHIMMEKRNEQVS